MECKDKMAKQAAIHRMPTRVKGDSSMWPTYQLLDENDAPIDVTDAKIDIWWRRGNARGPVVLKQSTQDNTIDVVNAVQGKIMPDDVLLDWGAGKYVADLQVIIGDFVQTPLKLELTIEEDATNKTYT